MVALSDRLRLMHAVGFVGHFRLGFITQIQTWHVTQCLTFTGLLLDS